MAKFQYTTAAQEAEVDDDFEPTPVELYVGDKLDRVIHVSRPSGAAFALLMADISGVDPDDSESIEPQHIGALLEFILSLLNAKDAKYIRNRLRNRKDQFSLASIESIYLDLVEEWSGHPTEESQDSTPSQATTGTTSPSDSLKQI